MFCFRCFTYFNPHSHAGSDLTSSNLPLVTPIISIHTPTQGVTYEIISTIKLYTFQSTLPRREWRLFSNVVCIPRQFQSTLPRREWPSSAMSFAFPDNFNPHSHAGSDFLNKRKEICQWISIHTPTQGVTITYIFTFSPMIISIHTPTQGVTRADCRSACNADLFQSTLPRREWL